MTGKAIVFVLDNTYADPARLAIRDVWLNAGDQYPVYVFHGRNLNDHWKDRLAKDADALGMDLRFRDIGSAGAMFQGIKCRNHVSDVTYAKLLMGNLFWEEEKIHTAYYFDVDILVMRDLSELFKIVPKKAIAAIDHLSPDDYKRLHGVEGMYINTGVIVANLVRWNSINAMDKFKLAIEEKADKFRYNDQDVFSAALIDEVEELPAEYNFMLNPRFNPLLKITGKCDWDPDETSPAILHFIGPKKPWQGGGTLNSFQLWRKRRQHL